MSFDVSPLAQTAAVPGVDRTRAGRTATPAIPDEVWVQVDAAARLAENLHAEGRAVRFDVHKLDGGVVASLVDDSGGLLRPLLLEDVIDVDRLTPEVGR